MNRTLHRATKIMLIRHAEKPSNSHAHGVTAEGRLEEDSLSVRGWQRAGALAAFFAPANGFLQDSSLAVPQYLFAAKPVKHRGSLRPAETITPLAEKLGIVINADFMKFEEEIMVEYALACPGVVLICWQHDFLPKIANHILGDNVTAPQHWSERRFDEVWVFDLIPESGGYRFKKIPQNLLAGDAF
jgi:hypothetical protein